MATVMWDNDGVMSGWLPNFYPWLCQVEGFAPIADCAHGEDGWHFYRRHGMTDEAFVARLNEYAENGGFGDQIIYPGVREAVIQIKADGHTQHIVSDRPASAEADTAWWVDTYCPEIDSVTLSRDKTLFKKFGPPTYYAIDDRHENIVSMRKAGIFAYLLTRPWNQHSDMPRVASVQDFAHIVTGQ